MGFNLFGKKNQVQGNTQAVQREIKNVRKERIVNESTFYRINDISKLTASEIQSFKEDDMFILNGPDNHDHYIRYDDLMNRLGIKKQVPQSVPNGQSVFVEDDKLNPYVMNGYNETIQRHAQDYADQYGDQGEIYMAKHIMKATQRVLDPNFENEAERYLWFTNNRNARTNMQKYSTPKDLEDTIKAYLKEHRPDQPEQEIDLETTIREFATLYTTINYNNCVNFDKGNEKLL